jgi:hypothetical protein
LRKQDLKFLEQLLVLDSDWLLGLPKNLRLTDCDGNFYVAMNSSAFVSDHAAVMLFVNLQ